MAWTIEFSPLSQRQLQRMDRAIALRIRRYMTDRVARLDDPRVLGAALQGSELGGYWRYRVGDYRLICEIQDHRLVVLVVELGHRGEVYR